MSFIVVGAKELALEGDVIDEQSIGYHSLAYAEVFSGVAGLNRRLRHLEFLAIDAATEDFEIKGVMGKNAELRNRIADQIVSSLQGGQAQILLMSCFQNVIGNIAGFGHVEITVIHRLGNNYRHQAIFISDLFVVARL